MDTIRLWNAEHTGAIDWQGAGAYVASPMYDENAAYLYTIYILDMVGGDYWDYPYLFQFLGFTRVGKALIGAIHGKNSGNVLEFCRALEELSYYDPSR